MPDQSSPTANSVMVTAGFTASELTYLIQGLQKLMAECHWACKSLSDNPLPDDNINYLMEYHNRRNQSLYDLQRRCYVLHGQVKAKQETLSQTQ